MEFLCTNDVKLRSFQYKYLMRIVPNNRYLFKCKIAPTKLCDICIMQKENNTHLFWVCMYTQEFWSHIRNFLNNHNIQVDISYLDISLYVSYVFCTLLYVHSSIAIVLMGKRELVALLNLSSWCLVMVERLFLAVPRGCLWLVIVVFPDHTHYF